MIQPNELRIGNWIYEMGVKVLQVLPNDILAAYQIRLAGNESPFNGIELTPRILEKAGFYHIEKTLWAHDKAQIDVEFYKNGGVKFLRLLPSTKIKTVKPLEHFHQLQNLCYDLTGYELTL